MMISLSYMLEHIASEIQVVVFYVVVIVRIQVVSCDKNSAHSERVQEFLSWSFASSVCVLCFYDDAWLCLWSDTPLLVGLLSYM